MVEMEYGPHAVCHCTRNRATLGKTVGKFMKLFNRLL